MPKTILFLAANPIQTDRLRLDREIREIDEGLRRARQRDKYQIEQSWALSADGLRRALLDHEPAIVHFSGHGAGIDGIVLEDSTGMPSLVSTEALEGLFALFPKIECVLLNACYSRVQAEAIARHIPYVIGIEQQIDDDAATQFAVGFYDALGADKSIEFAYKLGCSALQMAGVPAQSAPVLLIRADDPTNNDEPTLGASKPPVPSPVARKLWLPLLGTGVLLVLVLASLARLAAQPPQRAANEPAMPGAVESTPMDWLTASPSATLALKSDLPPPAFSAEGSVVTRSGAEGQEAPGVVTTLAAEVPRLEPLPTPPAAPTPPPATNVTNSAHRSIQPQLIVDSVGNVHLFWLDNSLRQETWYDLLHRQRGADGEWSDVTYLTDPFAAYDLGLVFAAHNPDGHICIFFEKVPGPPLQELDGLHLQCLADGTWMEDTLVMQGKTGEYHPAFSSDGSIEVVVQRAGAWRPELNGQDLTDGYGTGYDTVFEIDPTGGYHVAWIQTKDSALYELKYRYSNDAGKTWQPIMTLSDESSIPDRLRSVTDSEGRVHLVWSGFHGDNFHQYWTPGVGWSAIQSITLHSPSSKVSSITVDQKNFVQGVWVGRLGEVVHAWQQGDETWSSAVIDVQGGSREPTIAIGLRNSRNIAWVEHDNDIHYTVFPQN